MIRTLLAALVLAGSAGAQFLEIRVDASRAHGVIRPVFGIDVPAEPQFAEQLIREGGSAPLRAGPSAAMRSRLAESLPRVFLDDVERPSYDIRRSDTGGIVLWSADPSPSPAAAVALAMRLQGSAVEAAYYACRNCLQGGALAPIVSALGLAARLADTPRRVQLEVPEDANLTGLAGVSEDGQTVQVLLTRTEPSEGAEPGPDAHVLYIRNLPWGEGSFRIERFRLDPEPVHTGQGRGGMARISALLPAPSVELIVLRRADPEPGSDILLRRRSAR